MKHTLTLTGSSAALAAAMAAFDRVEQDDTGNLPRETTPSTPTGTGGAADALGAAAPTPTAPSQPTTPTETTDSDDDGDGEGVDSAGLPWDERIHSSNKKKGADGTWHKRRGGPSGDELAAIEAELRNGGQSEQQPEPTPAAPPPPPMPSAPAAPPPMPAASEPVEQQQPVPAPAPAPAPAASDDPEWDFFTFMQQAGPKFGEGDNQLSQAYLQQVCQQFGIGSITDLAANNDSEQIGKVVAQFRADGRW